MQYLGTVKSQNQIINIDIRNAENFKSVVKPTERTIKCEIDNSEPFNTVLALTKKFDALEPTE